MGITYIKREEVTWPEKISDDTTSWFQQLMYKPASMIAGFFGNINDVSTVYEENQALKQTLSFYALDRARLNSLEKENERLKEMLQFTQLQKEQNNYTYRIAQVVAVSPDLYNKTIKINLGSENGIKENMAVATEDGLIGRVNRVTPFYAHVEMVTNLSETALDSILIHAAVSSSEEFETYGTITSFDPIEERLLMTKIDPNDPIAEGDLIVTSGLGGVFPKDIIIGTVDKVEVGEFGLTNVAYIKASADFKQLHEVFVIEVPE